MLSSSHPGPACSPHSARLGPTILGSGLERGCLGVGHRTQYQGTVCKKKKNQVTGLVLGLDFNPDRLVLRMTCLAYLQVQLSWSDTGLGILCQHEVLA